MTIATSVDPNSGRPWPGQTQNTRVKRALKPLLVPILVVAVWHFVASSHLVSSTLLPTVPDASARLWHFLTTRDLWPDFKWTAFRVSAGFSLASIVGISIGLLIGVDRRLFDIMVIPIDFVRSIPITILYPVFVLTCGISHLSKIAMVFAGSVFVIALNTAYGVIHESPIRRNMARLFGASRFQAIRHITFFESLPQTAVGLRIALSLSLVIEILCEMFMGSEYGLGQRVSDAYTTYAIPDMYALIVIVGSFGYVLNRLLASALRVLLPWARE